MSTCIDLEVLVRKAVQALSGDRNPYRITSYLMALEGVSYFGMIADVRKILGDATRPEATSEDVFQDVPQRKPRTVYKRKIQL